MDEIETRRTRPWLPALLAAVISLAAFWLTAAPGTVLLESNSDLTLAAADLGCAHSPGYPLHSLTAHPFIALFSDPARATNLFSGFFGALTVFFLTLALAELGRCADGRERPWLAALGALAFGLSATLWTQASLTDVYTQHTAFLAAALYVSLRARRLALASEPSGVETVTAGLVIGLLLVSHNAGYAYLPALALVLWPALKRLKAPGWGLTFAALVLGLSAYLYLPIRASTGPLVNWSSPDSFYGFTRSLSQAVYADTPLARDWAVLGGQIAWMGRTWWADLAPGAAILGVAGLTVLIGKGRRQLLAGVLLLWLLPAALLLAISNFPVPQLVGSGETFLLTGAFVLAAGLYLGASRLARKWKRAGGPVAVGALTLILAATILLNLPRADLSERTGMEELGADLFASCPPRAILAVAIVQGDSCYFDGLVRRYARDRRPDLEISSAYQVGDPWYQRELADRAGLLPPGEDEQMRLWRYAGERAPDVRTARSFVDTSLLEHYSRTARRPLALAVDVDYLYAFSLAGREGRDGFVPLGLVEVWRPFEAYTASGDTDLGRLTLTRTRWDTLRFRPRPAGPHKYERAATDFLLGRLDVFAEAASAAGYAPRAAAAAVRAGWFSPLDPRRWDVAKDAAAVWTALARGETPSDVLVGRCLFYGLYGRAALYARRRLEEGTAGVPDLYALYTESLILGDEEGAARFSGILGAMTAPAP
ncbi:MAG: hypothetical protein A2Y64_09465 [Candidatus Coatesbacteria bacterium RBG_13_66_14]|uniref:DUF2723 domain-containing protein n=1 Tax=Candidatus Coatesbacteria bacterium RBG_13_66_14 TaxID=1817816 RepID=A0A1F5FG17_9BACT|nr:MAG: hypothetical protein A2Y64_09465 [Candidatus Coatesbacteria bacterium RBG_13_66_14]